MSFIIGHEYSQGKISYIVPIQNSPGDFQYYSFNPNSEFSNDQKTTLDPSLIADYWERVYEEEKEKSKKVEISDTNQEKNQKTSPTQKISQNISSPPILSNGNNKNQSKTTPVPQLQTSPMPQTQNSSITQAQTSPISQISRIQQNQKLLQQQLNQPQVFQQNKQVIPPPQIQQQQIYQQNQQQIQTSQLQQLQQLQQQQMQQMQQLQQMQQQQNAYQQNQFNSIQSQQMRQQFQSQQIQQNPLQVLAQTNAYQQQQQTVVSQPSMNSYGQQYINQEIQPPKLQNPPKKAKLNLNQNQQSPIQSPNQQKASDFSQKTEQFENQEDLEWYRKMQRDCEIIDVDTHSYFTELKTLQDSHIHINGYIKRNHLEDEGVLLECYDFSNPGEVFLIKSSILEKYCKGFQKLAYNTAVYNEE